MTLVELLNIANQGYPDQWLSQLYDNQTGEILPDAEDKGDSLALFIVRELTECSVDSDPSDVQLAAAVAVMEKAVLDLAGVFGALKKALDET